MSRILYPGAKNGTVTAPPSKSLLHRALILQALAEGKCRLPENISLPEDVLATDRSLAAIKCGLPAVADCGESGSTLRFLLPMAGIEGSPCCFRRGPGLMRRPIEPFVSELRRHGMSIREDGAFLYTEGKLEAGEYLLPGSVSSQFISALLMTLPVLPGDSHLSVLGRVESAPYIRMTEQVLRQAGIKLTREGNEYDIPGSQRPQSMAFAAEGDYSGAAAFLALGALSPEGITVKGLVRDSLQGDIAILQLLAEAGAAVEIAEDAVTVRNAGPLHALKMDAAEIPDLVPVTAALMAEAEGESVIFHAGRLREKESDRLEAMTALINGLGGCCRKTADGLVIRGGSLKGGKASSAGDHRIAMAAAVLAAGCDSPVELDDEHCAAKSYPDFWRDYDALGGGI